MRISIESVRNVVRRMRLLRRRVACGGALLVLTACVETKSDTNATAGATAGSTATTVSGVWSEADETSTWTATRDDANTWRIDETAQFGEDGRATRRFVFDSSGALRSVADEKQQTAQRGNATPSVMRAVLTVRFTGDSATSISKQVDGADRDAQAFEIDNAKRHAQQLWALLRQSAPSP